MLRGEHRGWVWFFEGGLGIDREWVVVVKRVRVGDRRSRRRTSRGWAVKAGSTRRCHDRLVSIFDHYSQGKMRGRLVRGRVISVRGVIAFEAPPVCRPRGRRPTDRDLPSHNNKVACGGVRRHDALCGSRTSTKGDGATPSSCRRPLLRQATLSKSQTRSGHSCKSAHIRGKNPFRPTCKAKQSPESRPNAGAERRVRTRGPSGNETRRSAWRGNKFFHHEGTKITKTIRDTRGLRALRAFMATKIQPAQTRGLPL